MRTRSEKEEGRGGGGGLHLLRALGRPRYQDLERFGGQGPERGGKGGKGGHVIDILV